MLDVILDTRYSILDAGQIVNDLSPMGRLDGDIFVGERRYIALKGQDVIARGNAPGKRITHIF